MMQTEIIKVKGMSCGHCVTAVEGSVSDLDGVQEVKVNLDDGKVSVQFDSQKVQVKQIKEAIEDQGYDIIL